MTGLYVHIPFCASRCIYCGFFSTTLLNSRERYVDALIKEMELRSKDSPIDEISSVYIGGGTPSQLSSNELHKLFEGIDKIYKPHWEDIEVTMECNPDDISNDFCKTLRDLPINRISMGAQTFSDSRLRFLLRRHTANEVLTAVERLKKAGIGNISIDLMFAFPNETIQEWEYDIDCALALEVQHISAYSLQYEEGTPLYKLYKQGTVKQIDDETYRKMYTLLCDKLSSNNYEHYEISNFARLGFRSRHNSSYWHNVPYIGIGASAHSYTGSTRSWNISDIRKYMMDIEDGNRPYEYEDIDEDTHYDDTVMTALRTFEGIDTRKLKPKYAHYILEMAQPYIDDGEMSYIDGQLRLTRDGIFISDMIMSDLMLE